MFLRRMSLLEVRMSYRFVSSIMFQCCVVFFIMAFVFDLFSFRSDFHFHQLFTVACIVVHVVY